MSQGGKGGGGGRIQDCSHTQGGGHQSVQSAHDVVVSGKHRLLSTTKGMRTT
jgi:hypothetical protein